ncbi:hypothetical protein [Actinomyces glycerinitolerans]|uniref:Uncharacterized protein n=1 Tax=Actinomyces glycerinitolerans TaxID=1892869 RepID=A0A1M4S0T7_9ACTO|nr:hypothetical protein [Actinomyces glycerinitolerans]SHE25808.1 Hypothetical protein ACGLYG10_2044 [Actinomyces glycerinitolerans]
MNSKAPQRRRPPVWRLVIEFFWGLLLARVILGLIDGDNLSSAEAWLTPRVWGYPLFFAVVGVYSYLYWMRHRDD